MAGSVGGGKDAGARAYQESGLEAVMRLGKNTIDSMLGEICTWEIIAPLSLSGGQCT